MKPIKYQILIIFLFGLFWLWGSYTGDLILKLDGLGMLILYFFRILDHKLEDLKAWV